MGYIEDGVKLLELAREAHALFENQPPEEKRKLLNFLLSDCSWKEGRLQVEYRKPFELLAVAVEADRRPGTGIAQQGGQNENWLLR